MLQALTMEILFFSQWNGCLCNKSGRSIPFYSVADTSCQLFKLDYLQACSIHVVCTAFITKLSCFVNDVHLAPCVPFLQFVNDWVYQD